MTDNNSNKSVLSYVVFAGVATAVLVATFVAIFIVFNNNNQKPVGIVQITANPSVTFIINDKDRVIDVKYDNLDAEILFSRTNFNGNTIEEASKIFARLSCQAGYIDTSRYSTGTQINVLIAHKNSKKASDLQEKIINKMNAYFDEFGVIAGATNKIFQDVQQQAQALNFGVNEFIVAQTILSLTDEYSIEQLRNMNLQELLNLVKEIYTKIDGIAYNYYDEYLNLNKTYLDVLNNQLNEILNLLFEIIGDIELKYSLNSNYNGLKTQINESSLSQEQKDSAIIVLDSLKSSIEDLEKDIKNQMEDNKKLLREESEEIFKDNKKILDNKISSYKPSFDDDKEYFALNKQEIQHKIQEFRKSIK